MRRIPYWVDKYTPCFKLISLITTELTGIIIARQYLE